jgi:hypothetical protein
MRIVPAFSSAQATAVLKIFLSLAAACAIASFLLVRADASRGLRTDER